MEKPQDPKIVEVPANSPKAWGNGTMVIVTPKIIDNTVSIIPKGRLLTVTELREKLARDFGADVTCPLTTGIFLRICVEAAEEDRSTGRKDITPYWRVIREDGQLIDKFPGGTEQQARLLKREGFEILVSGRAGKKLVIKDFEKHLLHLD